MKNYMSTILQCALYMLHKFFFYFMLWEWSMIRSAPISLLHENCVTTLLSYHTKGNFVVKHLIHHGQVCSQ